MSQSARVPRPPSPFTRQMFDRQALAAGISSVDLEGLMFPKSLKYNQIKKSIRDARNKCEASKDKDPDWVGSFAEVDSARLNSDFLPTFDVKFVNGPDLMYGRRPVQITYGSSYVHMVFPPHVPFHCVTRVDPDDPTKRIYSVEQYSFSEREGSYWKTATTPGRETITKIIKDAKTSAKNVNTLHINLIKSLAIMRVPCWASVEVTQMINGVPKGTGSHTWPMGEAVVIPYIYQSVYNTMVVLGYVYAHNVLTNNPYIPKKERAKRDPYAEGHVAQPRSASQSIFQTGAPFLRTVLANKAKFATKPVETYVHVAMAVLHGLQGNENHIHVHENITSGLVVFGQLRNYLSGLSTNQGWHRSRDKTTPDPVTVHCYANTLADATRYAETYALLKDLFGIALHTVCTLYNNTGDRAIYGTRANALDLAHPPFNTNLDGSLVGEVPLQNIHVEYNVRPGSERAKVTVPVAPPTSSGEKTYALR